MYWLVPHPRVVDNNSGGISWERGVPAPHQASLPKVPVPGRSVPTTSGCTNQWGLNWWKKLLGPQVVSRKEPTHRLTYSLTPSELQHQDSCLKGTSGTQGKTVVPDIKVSRGHCHFPGPSPQQSPQTGAYLRLHQPGQHFDRPWRSPGTPPHPAYRFTQAAFLCGWLVLAHSLQLPKSPKTSSWLQ